MMLKTSDDAMLVRPTTRAEKAALRRRVQTGELVEPFPCMFERADAWEQLLPDQRMRRILSTLGASRPDIVFCSYSAAVMHRLPVSYRLLSRVHAAAGTKEASHNSHHIVRHRMARVPSMEVDGVRVTPLVDTVNYLPKPFHMSEFLARVRALSRRSPTMLPRVLSFGDLELDRSTFELRCGDLSVRLANKEYQIMELLMRQNGAFITAERLLTIVWGYDEYVSPNVIWTYVSYLRRKIKSV